MRWLIIVLALAYVLSPYDLLPDFMAGRGWIDDILVVWLTVRYLLRHRAASQTRYGSDARPDGDQNEPSANVPRDPYQVLGLPSGASDAQINHAYRKLAGQYHPDKVAHLGEEFRRMAEERFKEIQQARDELIGRRS